MLDPYAENIGDFEKMKEQKEEWRPVKGWEGIFEVSNRGRIRSVERLTQHRNGTMRVKAKVRKLSLSEHGYYYIKAKKAGIQHSVVLHRAIAEAFIPNPENKPFVDHINTDKTDNRIENLRWVSAKENTRNALTMQHIKEACANEECKEKQRETKRKLGILGEKSISQYTIDGVFVKKYKSLMEAARSIKDDRRKARQICGNIRIAAENLLRTAYGYKWRWEK